MEELIQQLIDRLVALEGEFDSLPDLTILNQLIKDIEALKQNETLSKETIQDAVKMFGNGYITTKSDELFTQLNETFTKLSDDNSSHTETKSSELSLKIDELFQTFKQDLNTRFYKELLDFKQNANDHQLKIDDMVENALLDIKLKLRDVKNGKDGVDGKDGANGIGIKGDKGDDGINGVGIDDITYKSNTLTIFLSNGSKKEIKLAIPTYLGGGGGISQSRVMDLINEAIGSGGTVDAYTKSETDALLNDKANASEVYNKSEVDTNINTAIDDLINGASNILDTFGEVESVLDVLQSSISANAQGIVDIQPITTTTHLDFGIIGTKYKLFTISDANLTSGKKVTNIIYKPSNSKLAEIVKESIDDDEFDSIDFSIRNISSGSFQILAKSYGIINNYKTIQYTIQ